MDGVEVEVVTGLGHEDECGVVWMVMMEWNGMDMMFLSVGVGDVGGQLVGIACMFVNVAMT
uniref:Transmembrane protein n=1 Tax=Physcomitrium patens TaxID=3218 RepID=A0A2K1KTI7_PHYPA|nr:hypothetical protein PHYPA_004071 [Physcomitrium patens]